MARRPTRPQSRRPVRPARPPAQSAGSEANAAPGGAPPAGERERIMAAFLGLLAEKPIEQIGLAEIARQAGVSLAQLRGAFGSPLAIVSAYFKDVDRTVLAEDTADMEEESPRERLFDILMRRLEVMAPHRQAIRSLMRSARRHAALAFAVNALAVRSQKWMLSAAGINASGPRGSLRAQGLTLLFTSVLRAWVRDDDPGLARTMAALDRALARGQRFAGFVDDLCFIPSQVCRMRRRWRRRDRWDDPEESVAT
jgi:AcrR family transcriptional regulator